MKFLIFLIILILCFIQSLWAIEKIPKGELLVTFDDYPFVVETKLSSKEKIVKIRKILDALDKYKVKAIFFLNGYYLTEEFYPITKEIVQKGHRLGNHSYTHARASTLTEGYSFEIKRNHEIIQRFDNQKPSLYRYPYLDTGENKSLGGSESMSSYLNTHLKVRYGFVPLPVTIDSVDWKYDRLIKISDKFYQKNYRSNFLDLWEKKLIASQQNFLKYKVPQVALFHINELTAKTLNETLKFARQHFNFITLPELMGNDFYKDYLGRRELQKQYFSFTDFDFGLSSYFFKTQPLQFLHNCFKLGLVHVKRYMSDFFIFYNLFFLGLLVFWRKRISHKQSVTQRKISILVPAHNEEAHIEECLQALVDAKYEGFKEIIVVDDCSKDQTKRIIFEMADKFSEIIPISNERQIGKAESLNIALSRSTGEIVVVVDGDSVVEKDAICEIEKDFNDPDTHLSVGNIYLKTKSFIHLLLNYQIMYSSLHRHLASKVGLNIFAPGPLCAIRKSTLVKIGRFNSEGLCEDTELAVRMRRHGFKIVSNRRARVGTYFPFSLKFLFAQQVRWASGTLFVLKKNISFRELSVLQMVVFPIVILGVFNSVIYAPQFVIGVCTSFVEFLASGNIDSWVNGILDGFTLVSLKSPIINLAKLGSYNLLSIMPTMYTLNNLSLLVGPLLYLYASVFYCKRRSVFQIFMLLFIPLLWITFAIATLLGLKALIVKRQGNVWKKEQV